VSKRVPSSVQRQHGDANADEGEREQRADHLRCAEPKGVGDPRQVQTTTAPLKNPTPFEKRTDEQHHAKHERQPAELPRIGLKVVFSLVDELGLLRAGRCWRGFDSNRDRGSFRRSSGGRRHRARRLAPSASVREDWWGSPRSTDVFHLRSASGSRDRCLSCGRREPRSSQSSGEAMLLSSSRSTSFRGTPLDVGMDFDAAGRARSTGGPDRRTTSGELKKLPDR